VFHAIEPYGKNPIFQINKHIGLDAEDGYGICGQEISKEILEVNAMKPDCIKFFVNCMGGDVKESFDILHAILHSDNTEAHIMGFAYSTGGWIPLGAKVVKMVDYGSWMCHLPYNPENPDEKSVFLDSVLESVAVIISECSGKPKKSIDEVKELLKNKTYFNAQQMLDEGLIDEIIPSGLKVSNYKDSQKVFNKFIEEKYNTMAFEKVINRLKLVAGSDEDSVIAKIAFIENESASNLERANSLEAKLKASNDSREEMAAKLKELENARNEADCAYNKLKTSFEEMEANNKKSEEELQTLKSEKMEADNKFKTERAANFVNSLVVSGKINDTEESIKFYTRKAVENFEDVKIDFDSRPTNFKAPKAEFQKGTVIDKEPTNVFNRYKNENASRYSDAEKKRIADKAKLIESLS
jgi:ATP-dependent protease ClpP protease subunit